MTFGASRILLAGPQYRPIARGDLESVSVDLRAETMLLAARRGADIAGGPVFNPVTMGWAYPIYPVAEDGRRYVPSRQFDRDPLGRH